MDMAGGVVEVLHLRLCPNSTPSATLPAPLLVPRGPATIPKILLTEHLETGKSFEDWLSSRVIHVMAGPGRAGAVVLSWQSQSGLE